MKVEAKYVSPQMAEDLLATTDKNRSVSHARVLTLTNLMRTGRWQLNGETVIVSESGKLLDGQHRMYAIIEYGMPVQMLIATGAPDNAFETIDTGRARTASDIAGMEGVSNPVMAAAAAAMIWRMFHRVAINEVCSPQMTMDVIQRFPSIAHWTSLVASLGGVRRVLPPGSFIAALVYLETIAKKPLLAKEFYEGITKGVDLPEGSPILALRNRIFNMRAAGGVINATTCWSAIARTISAVEAHEPLTKLIVERASGAIRTPLLFKEHVEELPASQRIDKDWTHQVREQSGGRKNEKFQEVVRRVRGRAAS